MPVLLRTEKLPRGLDPRTIRRRAETILTALGSSDAELSLLLTNDEVMASINLAHRERPGATDVLSFPQDVPGLLGDVVISLETAARQVEDPQWRAHRRARLDHVGRWHLRAEVSFLLVHGVLHLLGFDHASPDQEEEMVAMERRLMAEFGGR